MANFLLMKFGIVINDDICYWESELLLKIRGWTLIFETMKNNITMVFPSSSYYFQQFFFLLLCQYIQVCSSFLFCYFFYHLPWRHTVMTGPNMDAMKPQGEPTNEFIRKRQRSCDKVLFVINESCMLPVQRHESMFKWVLAFKRAWFQILRCDMLSKKLW